MAAGILLAAADSAVQNTSIFSPVSPPAQSIQNLAILVCAISAVIFLIVESVLFYSIYRFRHRRRHSREFDPTRGPAPNSSSPLSHGEERNPSSPLSPGGRGAGGEGESVAASAVAIPAVDPATAEPPQVYGSAPIEIAWTAAPILIVLVIMLVSARTLWEIDVTPPQPKPGDNALFVTVIGRQWWWEFDYDRYNGQPLGFITANELHIPASDAGAARPVFLTLKSADVYHSFWVPRLAGKTALVPGQVNSLWIQANQPGLFVGQCAEYCGTQHANMLQRVVVDSPAQFNKWLDSQRKPAVENPSQASGKELFLSLSCVNCHRIRGTAANGGYAPDLTHLMSRDTLASCMIPNDPQGVHLRKWIADPQTIKPGCLMPSFGLTSAQVNSLTGYLRGLR